MLIRRRIDTARNFANKPVSFACNGVQTRRRVSYKAGAKEGGRTVRNSRNASRARKKILQKAARKAACVPDDRRKARRRVVQHPERTTAARYGGRDKGKGARLRTVGGDIGGKIGARVEGRQEGTTRRKDSACRSGMGAAPRACVYI